MLFVIAICATVKFSKSTNDPIIIAILIILCAFLFINMFALWKQPENKDIDTFKVPLFPFLPLGGVFVNVYLLFTLAAPTWYRFLVWFILGLIVYFAYGIRNSNENKKLNAQIHNEKDKISIQAFEKKSENKAENVRYF